MKVKPLASCVNVARRKDVRGAMTVGLDRVELKLLSSELSTCAQCHQPVARQPWWRLPFCTPECEADYVWLSSIV